MAVTLTNSFESGQPTGTTITSGIGGNSGGAAGNFFDSITSGTNTVAQFNSTSAYLGTLCGLFSSGAASNASSANWTATSIGTALPRVYGRTVIFGSSFAVVVDFVRFRGAGNQVFRLRINAAGKLELRANTGNTLLATSTTTFSTGTFYLIRWDITVGASATGVVYINTNLTTGAPDETMTVNSANFGTSNVDEANYGAPVSAISNAAAFRHDAVLLTDRGLPGPPTQSVSVSDAWQTSDAATRSVSLPRAVADTWATADVAGRSLLLPRSIADTWQSADVAARAVALPRPVTDTWATGDLASRAVALPRATADSWATSDTADRTLTLPRQVTDALAVSDTADRQLVLARAVADGWLTDDDASRVLVLNRPVADGWATSDTAVAHTHTPHPIVVYIGAPTLAWIVGEPVISWDIGQPVLPWIIGRPTMPSLSALATMLVQTPVTDLSSGLPVSPTGDAVSMAFMLGRAQPGDSDWKTGSWGTSSVNGQYFAQCLVGPNGGETTLTPGAYTIWVKIEDDPETPIAQSGNLTVY